MIWALVVIVAVGWYFFTSLFRSYLSMAERLDSASKRIYALEMRLDQLSENFAEMKDTDTSAY
jgi:hypothetical protein